MRASVGFLTGSHVDPAMTALVTARKVLSEAGIDTWESGRDRRRRGRVVPGTCLLVTLGGDGTLLHGARLAAPRGLPLLGVNLGRLGFLTELEAEDLAGGLERFLAGDFRVDERTLLEVSVNRDGRPGRTALALNEAVVQRAPGAALLRFELSVDRQEVGTIDADGVLVATASGSTAYSLAVGGPILEPSVEDLVLTPINPFALTVRPIVVPAALVIEIRLPRSGALLTVDGGPGRHLRRGDAVRVAGHGRRLRMVRFADPSRFYSLLRDKLGWGLPLVPTVPRGA